MEIGSNGGSDQDPPPKMEEQEEKPSKKISVSFFGMFAAADAIDCLLMLFGSLGAFVHGAALPVFFVLFGRIIDSLGHFSRHPHTLSSRIAEVHCTFQFSKTLFICSYLLKLFFLHWQNALLLIYLGLIVLASAWIGDSEFHIVVD